MKSSDIVILQSLIIQPSNVLSPALFLPTGRPTPGAQSPAATADGGDLTAAQKQAKLDQEGHRPYFHYTGSLTTPPCTEELDWFVMMDTVPVSDHQVGGVMGWRSLELNTIE